MKIVGQEFDKARQEMRSKPESKRGPVDEVVKIDTVGLMVEEMVSDNLFDQIGQVLNSKEAFNYDRVERVVFTDLLKQMLKDDYKKNINVGWINWTSARLEGLRSLNFLKGILEPMNLKILKEDIFGQHDFTMNILNKVWKHRTEDSNLNLLEIFKYTYAFEKLYIESEKLNTAEGMTDVAFANKIFEESNNLRIKACEVADPFKNTFFVKFLKEVMMPDLLKDEKTADVMELVQAMDKRDRKDLAAVYLNQVLSSKMIEPILKNPTSFAFVKDLQKKDKSQSVQECLNGYVIAHSKGELSF